MHRLLLPLLLGFGPVALAQSPHEPGYERIDKQPPTQEEIDSVILIPSLQNGISYIGGGVGLAERAALERWAKDYPLRIEMARKSGEYLGDMQVRVFNAKGETVLEAPSDGPLFFVRLPDGRYAVEVAPLKPPAPSTAGLAPQIREVTVTAGRQSRLFYAWP
ncbi:MAG: hypothetical protein ACOZAP_07485 [Pseudomonadota bacterium]|jgi:nucleoid-associated protein YgaU